MKVKEIAKNIYYRVLDMITLGRGIEVNVSGLQLKMPTRYYKFHPSDSESDNFNFIRKVSKKGMNCLDIGAHFGLFAILMQKSTGGKVICFEPTPTSQNILQQVIRLNKCDESITLVKAAVADKAGRAIFYLSNNFGSVENSFIREHHLDPNFNEYEVDVISLDEFLLGNESFKIGLLKIDVEGAEYNVLKGARRLLKEHRPFMVLGLHPKSIISFGHSHELIWDILQQCDYNIYLNSKCLDKKAFCDNMNVFDAHLIPKEKDFN